MLHSEQHNWSLLLWHSWDIIFTHNTPSAHPKYSTSKLQREKLLTNQYILDYSPLGNIIPPHCTCTDDTGYNIWLFLEWRSGYHHAIEKGNCLPNYMLIPRLFMLPSSLTQVNLYLTGMSTLQQNPRLKLYPKLCGAKWQSDPLSLDLWTEEKTTQVQCWVMSKVGAFSSTICYWHKLEPTKYVQSCLSISTKWCTER